MSGCASITKGITEAVISDSDAYRPARECAIIGAPFDGVADFLEAGEEVRLLVIHGIGPATTGYSSGLLLALAQRLGLDVEDAAPNPAPLSNGRASLLITRFENKAGDKSIVAYELNWSDILDDERAALDYDTVGASTNGRAAANQSLKAFFNARLTDPIAYYGAKRDEISSAFVEALCLMSRQDSDRSERHSPDDCNSAPAATDVAYVFITESISSRILLDALVGSYPAGPFLFDGTHDAVAYMLANQIVLLEAGEQPDGPLARPSPVSRCRAPDQLNAFSSMSIVSISDPNDVLSYDIPLSFAHSRFGPPLCAALTNVRINTVDPIYVPGIGGVANPNSAHTTYPKDKSVQNFIAYGLNEKGAAFENCSWISRR